MYEKQNGNELLSTNLSEKIFLIVNLYYIIRTHI